MMSSVNTPPTSPPYPTMERPSQFVSAQPQPRPHTSSSNAANSQRPYPTAPYPTYMSTHSNASTDSITGRLQNVQIQDRKVSVGSNAAAMGSNLSFQSSLDEQQSRQGSITSVQQPLPSIQQVLSPLERTHANFVAIRDRAIADQRVFTPSIQLSYVKCLLEACSQDAFLVTFDINGQEWGHMLSSSEVKKNQHTFVKHAIKLLKTLANDVGDPESQFVLACLYSQSPSIKVPKKDLLDKNYEKAKSLYAKAGSQGHAVALYRLAVSYELGIGTSVDEVKSLDSFERSAQQGCVPAVFRLGMIYSRGALTTVRSAQRAIHWLLEASKHGSKENPHAMFELGKVFERDLSLSQNSQQDMSYLRELDQLGYRFDEAKALYYYKESARYLYPSAQFKLGWCYEYGKLTCPIDAKKSIGWYSRAAKQGDSSAEMALSGWYLTGAKGILAPNDREAFLWASKAAQNGFDKAEYALGYYYESGLGCEKNMELAKKFYLRAATQGHEKSILRLKKMRDQR